MNSILQKAIILVAWGKRASILKPGNIQSEPLIPKVDHCVSTWSLIKTNQHHALHYRVKVWTISQNLLLFQMRARFLKTNSTIIQEQLRKSLLCTLGQHVKILLCPYPMSPCHPLECSSNMGIIINLCASPRHPGLAVGWLERSQDYTLSQPGNLSNCVTDLCTRFSLSKTYKYIFKHETQNCRSALRKHLSSRVPDRFYITALINRNNIAL